ncbi:MAG: LPP20 family lipoprotein [Calditrichia bacterium]|nr:LPP20 family lipoprotein [Calditrichia bacterium]
MKKLLVFGLMILMAVYFASCGGSKPATENKTNVDVPSWFISPPQDPNFIYATGTGESVNMQIAINKAKQEGSVAVAQQLTVKMKGLVKKFEEEIGTGEETTLLSQFTQATKAVINTELVGSKVNEQEIRKEGKLYTVFVLMEMPIGAASEALMDKLKKKEEMYTRFRSTQTFKELDKEINDYENYKKNQGY